MPLICERPFNNLLARVYTGGNDEKWGMSDIRAEDNKWSAPRVGVQPTESHTAPPCFCDDFIRNVKRGAYSGRLCFVAGRPKVR